jgi:hypothetical protein
MHIEKGVYTALTQMTDDWLVEPAHKMIIGVVLLDFSDVIDHKFLLKKLT